MLQQEHGYIWLDGQFVDCHDASVHLLSHSLHYGNAVFEGERAYNGKIFKMRAHHERLIASAAMLDMKVPFTVEELDRAAMTLLERNQLQNAYVRPIVWNGPESLGLTSLASSQHVAIAAWRWDAYFNLDDPDHQGLRLTWSDWTRPSPKMAPVQAKASGLYIISTLSKNKAEKTGFNDALMLDYRGYVAECTGANIFLVKDGQLKTPIADCFLNGITRQTVIEFAKELGVAVEEKHILPAELLQADEVFITGTAVEIVPVGAIQEQHFEVGPITKKLIALYHKRVRGLS